MLFFAEVWPAAACSFRVLLATSPKEEESCPSAPTPAHNTTAARTTHARVVFTGTFMATATNSPASYTAIPHRRSVLPAPRIPKETAPHGSRLALAPQSTTAS